MTAGRAEATAGAEAAASVDPAATAPERDADGFVRTAGTAIAAALSRPAAWSIALVAFLLRGGILVFVLPFLVLPTVTGLATLLAPILFRLAVGQPDPAAIVVVTGLVLGLLAWILLGGLVAAGCEVVLIDLAVHDLDAWAGARGGARAPEWSVPPRQDRGDGSAAGGGEDRSGSGSRDGTARWSIALQVLGARLLARVPFALALVWLTPQVVAAAYAELLVPSDLDAPLWSRVLRHVAVPVVVVAAAWVVGSIVGALAARSVVLAGRGPMRAVGNAVASAVRHPVATMLAWATGAAGMAALVLTALVAAAAAWGEVRTTLPDPAPTALGVASVLLLVATWSSGLFLAAVASTWRSTWWTGEWLRRRSLAARRRVRAPATESAHSAH